AHPSSPCGCDTSTLIALPRTACRPAAPRDQAPGHTPLAAGEPARSPFFCGDLLHHLNLEIALRHKLLQPRILRLELPQALDVARLQSTETLAPSNVGNATCHPDMRPSRQRDHRSLPSSASARRAARRAPMRSGKRTRRPLRKTTSMINDGGATAGAGNATWSAISTAEKHACGPGVIDRLPDRASLRQPCS